MSTRFVTGVLIENIIGQGENAGNLDFFCLPPQPFFVLLKANSVIGTKFNMSPKFNEFSLDLDNLDIIMYALGNMGIKCDHSHSSRVRISGTFFVFSSRFCEYELTQRLIGETVRFSQSDVVLRSHVSKFLKKSGEQD